MIKEASKEMGADFYELFTAIIVNRKFDDVMNKDNTLKTKARLGQVKTDSEKAEIKLYALQYHKDIVSILDEIKRELLLLLKTNNYLRAIDKRLGNPHNQFQAINDISWEVYSREMKESKKVYLRELLKYYFLKFLLFLYKLKVRILHLFGIKATKEELEDFGEDFY